MTRRSILGGFLAGVMLTFFLVVPCSGTGKGVSNPRSSFPLPSIKSDHPTHPTVQSVDKEKGARLVQAYGRLPLHFIENRGQVDERVRYYERGSGHSVFFTGEEIVFSFGKSDKNSRSFSKGLIEKTGIPVSKKHHRNIDKKSLPQVVQLIPLGMNKDVQIVAKDLLEGKVNYFIGKDSKKWRTNISTYRSVLYQNAYRGIDLKFYGNNRQLEYDIIVRPGVDPSQVRFEYKGIEGFGLQKNGDLCIRLENGHELVQKKPRIYQDIGGKRVVRQGAFRLESGAVLSSENKTKDKTRNFIFSFQVASYNRVYALVIDPVLVYSTYLGGGDRDTGYSIAVDNSGNAYVTGMTASSDFPTKNPLYHQLWGGYDAFVTKINSSGTALVYSTYLGGSDWEEGCGIAVDSAGNSYVTGYTRSSNFPTKNALYPEFCGGSRDAFVTKINPAGTALVYSTYLGGDDLDEGCGVAVDSFGNAYVTGETDSSDYPTKNAIDHDLSGVFDIFVTKINSGGTVLEYSTYLGGSLNEADSDIAVDSSGNAYVTGWTYSPDFPTKDALYSKRKGVQDVFVTKINPGGTAFVYSTYLGGSRNEADSSIAVDALGNAYVTGWTYSSDFPTKNPLYPDLWGTRDAFVTKINPTGTALVYSTYLGGSNWDEGRGIAADSSGNTYVTGVTRSSDFPTKNPLYTEPPVRDNAFVTKINSTGTVLLYATYLGGSGYDEGYGIAVDNVGNAYVTGNANSSDFPTKNPIYSDLRGPTDVFITKIGKSSLSIPSIVEGSLSTIDAKDYYELDVGGSKNVTINLLSTDFDGYLRIRYDVTNNIRAEDDDSHDEYGLNARLSLWLSGKYIIEVTSYNGQGNGSYTLVVRDIGNKEIENICGKIGQVYVAVYPGSNWEKTISDGNPDDWVAKWVTVGGANCWTKPLRGGKKIKTVYTPIAAQYRALFERSIP